MYFSVCPIVQSGACANKREPITSAESEFPKESIVCRTVTRGSLPEEASLTAATNHQNKSFNSPTDIGNETVINRNFVHKTEEITRHQKSHISLKHLHWPARRGSLSSTKSSLLNTNKSIPNTVNMINSRLADLLLSRLSMSNSSNHSCVHQSTTKSPARPVKDYHHHPTGQWSLGMILISVIILSSFSTTSVVMCASLGHDDGGGGEHGSALATGSPRLAGGLMTSNSKLLQHPREVDELKESSFSVHNRGQIHHPPSSVSSAPASPEGSLGRGRRATEDREENSHLLPTNYHLERFHHQQPEEINPFLRSPPIQKLLQQHKDFALSNVDGKDEDNDDPDGDDNGSPDSQVIGGARFGLGEDDDNNAVQSEWETVIDPHLYVLTEWNSQPYQERFPLLQQRKRRNSGTGPSLSIVNPLDVLRQRLLLEIARRRMRQSHNQIIANEEILRKIGRRR